LTLPVPVLGDRHAPGRWGGRVGGAPRILVAAVRQTQSGQTPRLGLCLSSTCTLGLGRRGRAVSSLARL